MPIKNFACDIHDIQKQLEFHIYPSIEPPFIACDTINMITAQRLLYAIALQIKTAKQKLPHRSRVTSYFFFKYLESSFITHTKIAIH